MPRKIATILFLLLFATLHAQIPQGYYNAIDQKQSKELKTSLSGIIKEHKRLRYNDLWEYFRTTDVRDDGLTVWDMYSDTNIYFNPNNKRPGNMQKEHVVPKSWWAPSKESERYDAYTDLHHLYPSDGSANKAKSNYILGVVSGRATFDNGLSKVGRNKFSYPGSPSVNAFEPCDEYKGDFARIYFYMITCYEDYSGLWQKEALRIFNNETYPVLQPWAQEMLMSWHRQDPVSEKEIVRNEEVFAYQNNRNPFVDLPQLAEYIWGDSINYLFVLPERLKTSEPTLISPPNLSEVVFGNVYKESEVSQTIYLKGLNLEGSLRLQLAPKGSPYFSISSEKVDAEKANNNNYPVTITYNPQKKGRHATQLIIEGGGLKNKTIVYIRGNFETSN